MNKLFHYFLCPSSRFTRIILNEKKIDFDLFIENFSDPSEAYLFKNPGGFFPVLNTSLNENISHNENVSEKKDNNSRKKDFSSEKEHLDSHEMIKSNNSSFVADNRTIRIKPKKMIFKS